MSDLLYSRLRVSATVDIFDGRLYAGQTVELREGRVYDATTGRYILDLGRRGTPGGARAWARFERATAATSPHFDVENLRSGEVYRVVEEREALLLAARLNREEPSPVWQVTPVHPTLGVPQGGRA